jgi:hypothetical protein
MDTTKGITALIDDTRKAGGITRLEENWFTGPQVDLYLGGVSVRVLLTETGGFDSARRTDVRVDQAKTIRTIKNTRRALGLETS